MKVFNNLKDSMIIGLGYILYLAVLMFSAYRTFQVSPIFFTCWCIFSPGLVLIFVLNEKFKIIKYNKAYIPPTNDETLFSDSIEIMYVILAAFVFALAFAVFSFFI